MLYMVTFTINIPQMLAYIYHTWILWDILWKINIFETTSQMALYHVFEFHRIAAYSMNWSNPMFPLKKKTSSHHA